MAIRTETEVMDLIRAITKLGNQFHTYLTGTAAVDLAALETEIAVGDQVPENSAMTASMGQFVAQLGRAYDAYKALVQSSSPALGRLAGSPDLSDTDLNFDSFAKYSVDNSKEIEKRGFTKDTAATVVGSGTGLLKFISTDLNSDIIDIGHVETFVLECDRDFTDGVVAGREEFLVKGEDAGIYPWDENGSALSNSYDYGYGRVTTDFSINQPRIASGGKIISLGASSGGGNLLRNGDFETAISGSGTTKLSQWDITTGDATITQEDTDPINGSYSLDASADFVMEQLITQGRLKSGVFYGLGLKVERKSSATGTVTVKIMDRDEGTTHGTLTIDVSTLTNDTPVLLTNTPFFIPLDAEDLKVVIELSTLAVGTITFDDALCGAATLVNGYLVFLADGTVQDASGNAQGRFKRGDTFQVDTTSTDAGLIQKYFFNMGVGRYNRSDTTATVNWEDWS